MDNLKNFRRTNYCGDLRLGDTGKTVSLCGWVQRQRDLGGLIFVDLRDRTGLIQLSFDDGTDQAVFEKASSLRSEYVIAATGTVRERESKTDKIATGAIEVYVTELRLLAKAETPPFEIVEHSKANDMLRLKYRYLDLRRPDMQKMIATRHKVTKIARDYFDEQGFYEIETPMLTKSTPEGARDYLVPSRVHPGKFYALPQSPQQYKQLLMLSGPAGRPPARVHPDRPGDVLCQRGRRDGHTGGLPEAGVQRGAGCGRPDPLPPPALAGGYGPLRLRQAGHALRL